MVHFTSIINLETLLRFYYLLKQCNLSLPIKKSLTRDKSPLQGTFVQVSLRRINFQTNQASASVLYKNCNILKLRDHVNLQNFLFAHDSIKNNLPNSLRDQVCLVNNSTHTRSITFHQLQRPPNKTIVYGSNSIKSKSVDIWNYINHEAHQEKLHEKSRVFCKSFVKNFLINRY